MLPSHFLGDSSSLEAADAAAAIIVVDDGRYLMQLRDDIPGIFYPGFWGCFGGAISAGEEPIDALRRELFEELEFETKDCRKFFGLDFDFSIISGKKHHRHYYEVSATEKEVEHFRLHEGADMKLFGLDEVLLLPNLTPYDAFALWVHGARRRIT
jgi:8-oxo-dGTP pyrophosphatase MutT (NUDIX family)